uniref:Long-chain-fatty-acid--CoA ligase n=1 Tax=Panagrellus redivivus TaxID=6233 RepID=A0A7E4VBD5_PANRE
MAMISRGGIYAVIIGKITALITSGAALLTTLGALGVGFYVWNLRNLRKIKPIVDLDSQTRVLPDGSRIATVVKSEAELHTSLFPAVTTLYDVIRHGLTLSNNGPMVGYRPVGADGKAGDYKWLKYDEVLKRSINIGEALRVIGIATGQESFIGVYAKNRPEWIIIENAVYNFNNVIVPLYETLGAEACVFSLNQAEIEIVFVDVPAKVHSLLKEKPKIPSLKHFVVMDGVTPELVAQAAEQNVKVYSFAEFEALGTRSEKMPLVPPKPDDLATICYTSGTTGEPKGVMLTHANIIADGTTLDFFKTTNFDRNDVMMSFLPLAHMFERVVESVVFTVGGRVGYFRGDIRLLADDIKTLRPTVLPVVPRVLNRIYDRVMAEAGKSALKKGIFDLALAVKQGEINRQIIRNDSLADEYVFKKIREQLGGRVRFVLTGSAPLAENVLNFMRCALGCVVVEGYGQTECVACATITLEGDAVAGHVGVPTLCNKIKLVDVDELGYFAKDNAGEVCIKGANVFKGYYKNEAQTKATLDADGWLHTGDIGRWTEKGTLKIVDRKKHIFKLAQGEYVAPERIENIYSRSKYVAQSFVYGESLKTCLIAIVVPDPEVLPIEVEKKLKLSRETRLEELCRSPDVKKLILDDMIACGKAGGLFSFEQAKDIYLCPEAFSIENDLMTPTLKIKRPKLKVHFKNQIANMYKALD